MRASQKERKREKKTQKKNKHYFEPINSATGGRVYTINRRNTIRQEATRRKHTHTHTERERQSHRRETRSVRLLHAHAYATHLKSVRAHLTPYANSNKNCVCRESNVIALPTFGNFFFISCWSGKSLVFFICLFVLLIVFYERVLQITNSWLRLSA